MSLPLAPPIKESRPAPTRRLAVFVDELRARGIQPFRQRLYPASIIATAFPQPMVKMRNPQIDFKLSTPDEFIKGQQQRD